MAALTASVAPSVAPSVASSSNFTPYEKMAKDSNKFSRKPKGQFVCTEKVHGANFR